MVGVGGVGLVVAAAAAAVAVAVCVWVGVGLGVGVGVVLVVVVGVGVWRRPCASAPSPLAARPYGNGQLARERAGVPRPRQSSHRRCLHRPAVAGARHWKRT